MFECKRARAAAAEISWRRRASKSLSMHDSDAQTSLRRFNLRLYLACKFELHDVSNTFFDIGPFRIQSGYIIHPGPTVGYRIIREKLVFTYMPDHEPALGSHGMINDPKWVSGYDLAEQADILLHDSQYTKEEYIIRRGWGHSSIYDAGLFAEITSAKHTLFAHHDPSHSDKFLEEMLALFKSGSKVSVGLAQEGSEIELV